MCYFGGKGRKVELRRNVEIASDPFLIPCLPPVATFIISGVGLTILSQMLHLLLLPTSPPPRMAKKEIKTDQRTQALSLTPTFLENRIIPLFSFLPFFAFWPLGPRKGKFLEGKIRSFRKGGRIFRESGGGGRKKRERKRSSNRQ